MQFKHSEEIEPALYKTDGLSIDVPLRLHQGWKEETRAALRAQKDWSYHVYSFEGYHGALGRRYHFVSVTIPECLPERLPIIAYANEFAFLYDDDMEKLDWCDDTETSTEFLSIFQDSAGWDKNVHIRPEKTIQKDIMREMMRIDPPRAKVMMATWDTFVQSANRERSQPPMTLDEYIPARVIDCGEVMWFGFITFGMALTIGENQLEQCHDLARPAYAALGLTNDLYSWRKEKRDAKKAGQDRVWNAIWVIMKERGVGEDEAISICREAIQKWISRFQQNIRISKDNPYISQDVKTYHEALLYSYVGNLVWSIECPRYRV